MADCTCPPSADGEIVPADKACPEHGLEAVKSALLELDVEFQHFDYGDGISILATNREAADATHAAIVARRNRAKA